MTMVSMTKSHEALGMRGEIERKALHLLALVLPIGMLVLRRPTALLILGCLAVIAIAAEIARDRHAAAHAWIDRWFGRMMRPVEREPGTGFCGATWVVVASALLLAAFPATIAAAGMIIGLVGDAAAAVVGRMLGHTKWPKTGKTLEGTVAFCLASLLVAALFIHFSWTARIAAVLVAAVAEALPIPLNDNLVVPFAAAAVLQWLI
jgi:dolichol kinase